MNGVEDGGLPLLTHCRRPRATFLALVTIVLAQVAPPQEAFDSRHWPASPAPDHTAAADLDAEGAADFLAMSAPLNAPFQGGTMVPMPLLIVNELPLNGGGDLSLSATWPASLPGGSSLGLQAWMADPAGPAGFTATNALQATPAPDGP